MALPSAIPCGRALDAALRWTRGLFRRPPLLESDTLHARALLTVREIDRLLFPGNAPASLMERRLKRHLCVLQRRLAERFAEEESGEFLDELNAALPGASRRVAALRREHRILIWKLSKICGLAADLKTTDGPTATVLAREAESFTRTLRRHERAESDLLVEARYADEGCPD